MPQLFAHINWTYLLYLFYGAAFLFLGVSIAAKDMKGSDLKLADRLWLLGMFGFFHGAHEWLELGPLIEGENLSFQEIFFLRAVTAVVVAISFVFLLLFGLSLIRGLYDKGGRWTSAVLPALFTIWGLLLWHYRSAGEMLFVRQAEIGARYIFGFPGGLVAAYGLIAYSREARILGRSASRRLLYAGVTFIFYALFGGILSSGHTMPLLGAPVELLRGISAFFITYFIVNALNIFDVEARKKIKQQSRRLVQAEKLTSLGRLAAGIAHEINNPLTNASLGIQTLKSKLDGICENEISGKLDAVERNIDRASAIAKELLQFSRQKDAEFVPCDLNRVIMGALTLLRHKLGGITVLYDPMEVPAVMGDPLKLEQVFINILSNSMEAMPSGGGLTISATAKKGAVEVRVADTGTGVPQEHLSQVFDPFFTTKEVGAGTGLGLSISYGIVRQHHGIIDISSELGRGTTVIVSLPAKERYAEGHKKDIDR